MPETPRSAVAEAILQGWSFHREDSKTGKGNPQISWIGEAPDGRRYGSGVYFTETTPVLLANAVKVLSCNMEETMRLLVEPCTGVMAWRPVMKGEEV